MAIEDGGFEIRDQIMWVYGSGFPKSHNLGKAYDKKYGIEREVMGVNPNARGNPDNKDTNVHDYGFLSKVDMMTKGNGPLEGWGTALKPSHEPMVLARKPLSEKTVLANAEKWGTGGLNIDASRVPYSEDNPMPTMTGGITTMPMGWDRQDENDDSRKPGSPDGRWPANFIHDGSQQVLDLFPDVKGGNWTNTDGARPFNNDGKKTNAVQLKSDKTVGSAARFFYVPKVSKKDRNEGLDGELPTLTTRPRRADGTVIYRETHPEEWAEAKSKQDRAQLTAIGGADEFHKTKHTTVANTHPTVKPTDLMHYLIRMVTPAGGTVLDPFMGSGSTGKAAIRNGYNFIGIEMEEDSFEVAKARIEYEAHPTEVR